MHKINIKHYQVSLTSNCTVLCSYIPINLYLDTYTFLYVRICMPIFILKVLLEFDSYVYQILFSSYTDARELLFKV